MYSLQYLRTLLLLPFLAPSVHAAAHAQAPQREQVEAHGRSHLPRYTVTRLPTGFSAIDINNAGSIIGMMSTHFGERGFILRNGTLTDLGTLNGPTGQFTNPARVNASDQVTGWSVLGSGLQRAFVWTRGVMQDLGTLGGNNSVGNDINDAGMVVGFSEFGGTEVRHAAAWWRGNVRDLGTLGGASSNANAVNNYGVIVGDSSTSLDPLGDTRPFVYYKGRMRDLGSLGGNFASALAINDRGQIAGNATLPDGRFHVFLYENGRMRDLGSLGGNFAAPTGINNSGMIVGIGELPGAPVVGFLYAKGKLMTVDSLIHPALGWRIEQARSINDRGQIVGYGCRNNLCSGVRLDPIR